MNEQPTFSLVPRPSITANAVSCDRRPWNEREPRLVVIASFPIKAVIEARPWA